MEPKLKVEYMDVGELIPYANNAKEHPDWQVEQIAASIRQFGMCDPVGVWTNPDGGLEIVEGHGRVLALKEMGVTRCPVIKLDHLDDEGRRAYTHIHNQTNLTTGFDWEALDAEIAQMPEIDWSAFGFENVTPDDFGTEFILPDENGPQFKTVTLHLTPEQLDCIDASISGIDRDCCVMTGGNEYGDKICEMARQWAER